MRFATVEILVLLLCAGTAIAEDGLPTRIDAAMASGATFLLDRQAADGSWRSAHYGALKDGYSLSPFALSALFFAPSDDARLADAYRHGVDFLATLAPQGRVETYLSYPVYSVAGALLVMSVPANRRHGDVRAGLVTHLRSRQLTEQHGWSPDDPAYGGWGYWPGDLTRPRSGGPPPHHLLSSNLSSTLYALGALSLAGVALEDPAFVKARIFVERCQNFGADPAFDDGGFFFTPSNELQNKAGAAGTDRAGRARYRSYGSMTADGLRALRRLGFAPDHARVVAARGWWQAHFDARNAPGPYPPRREVQRRSVYYYWAWSAAHVALWEQDHDAARALAEAVLDRQRDDGSWTNASTDLREDDPLIATPFAMAALGVARYVLTGSYRTAVPTETR